MYNFHSQIFSVSSIVAIILQPHIRIHTLCNLQLKVLFSIRFLQMRLFLPCLLTLMCLYFIYYKFMKSWHYTYIKININYWTLLNHAAKNEDDSFELKIQDFTRLILVFLLDDNNSFFPDIKRFCHGHKSRNYLALNKYISFICFAKIKNLEL